jgi:membrane protein implicated in regulation of membrane protease activity
MKKLLGSRTSIMIVGVVALLALAYLAASLGRIEFKPAQTYEIGQSSTGTPAAIMLPDVPLWLQIFFWLILLFFLASIFWMFSPKERKRLTRRLGSLTIVLLVLAYVGYKYGSAALNLTPEPMETEISGALTPPPGGNLANPSQEFVPPSISPVVSFVITLLIVSGVLALSWWLIRRQQGRRVVRPLEEIAGIAHAALDDLSAGKDWGDTIINCYVRMNASVGERRGFRRKAGMTPAEFAEQLEHAGLPGYTTRRLTQLFEQVRYGARKSSKEDINEAIACLTDILHACGEAL